MHASALWHAHADHHTSVLHTQMLALQCMLLGGAVASLATWSDLFNTMHPSLIDKLHHLLFKVQFILLKASPPCLCFAGAVAAGGVVASQTDELTFLRGLVMTDTNGLANFETIFPGRYNGRSPHIHVKVLKDLSVRLFLSSSIKTSIWVHSLDLFFCLPVCLPVSQSPLLSFRTCLPLTHAKHMHGFPSSVVDLLQG